MNRGETLELKEKSNEEWWLVENSNSKEGFAPANYLKEIGVQMVPKQQFRIVKKAEKIKVKRPIPRKTSIKDAVSTANALAAATVALINQKDRKKDKTNKLRRKTTSIQPRQLQHLSTENLKHRQVEINHLYSTLFNGSIEKRKQLDNSICFYKWLRKYEELLRWIKEKKQSLSIDKENSLLDHPDAAKRRYQAFNTDFLTNQKEFIEVTQLAGQLIEKKTDFNADEQNLVMTSAQVRQKHDDLEMEWKKLMELKKYWDNAVKAIECIDRFNLLYADVNDLLNEKLKSSIQDDVSSDINDIKSVRALQRKQDKLERDIGPIETNVNEFHKTADEVCKYFPQEKSNVRKKLALVDDLWYKLRDDVKIRKEKLDEKHGLESFENEVHDFHEMFVQIVTNLNDLENPLDLRQCEDMQKKYKQLEQESVNELTFKFNDLRQMSEKQLAKRGVIGNVEKINSHLEQVANEHAEIDEALDDKNNYLNAFQKYLKFKEDANNFELSMVGQEAFLQFEDLGSSSDNADALLKRHDEFLAKMNAQDEKMKNLNEQFIKLNNPDSRKHFAFSEIERIFNNLIQKRKFLKDTAVERKRKLKNSKEFFEFKNQCDDLNGWINERRRHAQTIYNSVEHVNSAENFYLIGKYLNKHEALEKELTANRTRLDRLKQIASTIEATNNKDNLIKLVNSFKDNWFNLENEAISKGKYLKDKKDKADLSATLSDVDARMKNLEDTLNTKYNTGDLRSVKEALKKHDDLRKQLAVEVDLVRDLSKVDSSQMNRSNSNQNQIATENAVREYLNKFNLLNPLIERKQNQLEVDLEDQQLIFDINEELKWIELSKKQIEIINAAQLPTSLLEAQNAVKKQSELERSIFNKQPIIEKICEQADNLLKKEVYSEFDELKKKLEQLKVSWSTLFNLNEQKRIILNECYNEQEILDELNQIHLNIMDKLPLIETVNANVVAGKEDSVLNKHLVKLEQLEDDLKGYDDILDSKLENHYDNPKIEQQLQQTRDQLEEMLQLICERRQMLKLQQGAREFECEASKLMQWINQKRTQAQSEEYGQDFEHLALINAKFLALKDEVRSCEESRYASIRKLSTNLLNAKSPDAKSIRKKIDDLKIARELLDEDLHNRELHLNSAAEIHSFNKDVQDMFRRIDDKELAFMAVENRLGRDIHSCESLIRKHDIYQEELNLNLRPHLHELIKLSENLRDKYPGDTAESIAAETSELIERFNTLRMNSDKRDHNLKQTSEYFKFLACIRDVNDWMEATKKIIKENSQSNDLFTVKQIKQEHNGLSFEMSQRDDVFKELDNMSIQLTAQKNHPNQRDVSILTDEAMTNRENLFRLWKSKSDFIDSQHEFHLLYREVTQLVTLLSSQENLLNKSYNESISQLDQGIILNVEDLEDLVKKQENLSKKIDKQSIEKTDELKKFATELLAKERERVTLSDQIEFNVNETTNLQQKLEFLIKKQNDVKLLSNKRSKQLKDILKFSNIRRDIDEFEVWIDERIRNARNLNISNQKSSSVAMVLLNDKVKLFQKQKALGVEIETNSDRYSDLIERCKSQLVVNKTVNKQKFESMTNDLTNKWNELRYEFQLRSNEFEEARDVLEFNDQLEQVEEWLKEKELMLQNGDTGRDYEHCLVLCKRADEAISPINEQKLQEVIQMGDKLVKQGRTDRELVLEKKNRLLNRYKFVSESVDDYKMQLNSALEIHSFNRDYDDLRQRMNEKILLLRSDIDLRTLDSVQVAQSKVVELESDLKAIKHKLDSLNNESYQFISGNSENDNIEYLNVLKTKMAATEAELENLENSLQLRKVKLESALHFQKFMVEYRDLKNWITDIFNRIQLQPEPLNLSEAETALNLHQERRTEIDGKRHRFVSFQNAGREISERVRAQSDIESPIAENQKEISKLMKELIDAQQDLNEKCEQKHKFLNECSEYQDLRESWKQLDVWSKKVSESLSSKDTGDSVLSVKSLLTKHDNIENSVKLQIGSLAAFDNIEQRGFEMIKQNSHHSLLIQQLIKDSQHQRKQLDSLCSNRRKNLEDSLMFHNFLLNYYEAQQWIKEKTASAMDKTYLDLTNLLTKIQRHQVFIVDLKKNGEKRVTDVHSEADTLIARHQTTAMSLGPDSEKIITEIQQYIKDLNDQWNALKAATESKKKCLEDSHNCVVFTRLCNDLISWCDEVEAQLGSDDNGHDMSSCKMLLLRHETLTRQITSQEEKIKEISNLIEISLENFMFNKMKESADTVNQNYLDLQDPCVIRKENLEESLSLFTIMHDLDDSFQFINEKQQGVMVEDLGINLSETKKLQKRHTQIKQEVLAHQPLFLNSIKTTKQLIERKHYAHEQLEMRLTELEEKWHHFKALIEKRSASLEDAFEVQKFYTDIEEIIEWLKEKKPELASEDYGKDDLSSMSYLKKLDVLMNDIKNNQKNKCSDLAFIANNLQKRNIYDKKNVARKQVELEQFLDSLIELGNVREQHIKAMLKVFEFERECEADMNWFKDQQVIASSQDFGSDLEHAESLLNKFNEFISNLEKNSDRIQKIDDMAQQLCENEFTPNSHIERIDERCSTLNEMWKDLNTLAEVRRQTLEGAIEVHAFDKDCDDLITWAVEKESFLKQEDIGYDLASVFTLAKQQDSLENELSALSEELERLNSEAQRLCSQYPETKDHIETRLEDADTTYNDLYKQLLTRKEKIQQSQSAFLLSNEFNELSEWLRDIQSKITSNDLSTGQTVDGIGEVNNAEMLIKKHREYKVEIDLQQPKIKKFISKSDDLIKQDRKIFSSKIEVIRTSNINLLDTWQSRQELYEQNLEYNKMLREIKLLDAWLSSKDSFVHTDILGDNVQSVEALLKQHDDFEGMLSAMEHRFENLKKENKLEKTLKELKQRELENKQQQEKNFEQEKKKEVERKKKMEKRRQDDRRRTQEIISIVTGPSQVLSQTPQISVPIEIVDNESKKIPTFTKNIEATSFVSDSTEEKTKPYEQVIPIVITSSTGTTAIKSRKDRNRTRSIRDKYKLPIRLPNPTIKEYIMRKQEYQKGGQRSPIREYQLFFTTIHGNLLCCFASEKDYNELNAANQPINLFKCKINRLEDATVQRDVLHLKTMDGAEYLVDVAGEQNDEKNLDLWSDKIVDASNTESLPMFSVAGNTNIEHTADPHDNISGRPPRSRLPLVIPMPKSITGTSEFVKEENKQNLGLTSNFYSPESKNYRYGGQEIFAQDSNGLINENSDLSIETTDNAPYRYKNDSNTPSSRLSPTGAGYINSNTKIGESIRQAANASRKGHISPKNGSALEIPDYLNQKNSNTILEESFRSVSSYGNYTSQQNTHTQQNESFFNESSATHKNIIYSQSSSKTLGELVKNADQNLEPRYDPKQQNTQLTVKTKNLVMNSLIHAVSPTYHQARSSTDYGYDFDQNDRNREENNTYKTNNYDSSIYSNDEIISPEVKNLIISPGSNSSSQHQKNLISPTLSVISDASSKDIKSPKSEKHKKNIFGSLFGNKTKKEKSSDKTSKKSTKNK